MNKKIKKKNNIISIVISIFLILLIILSNKYKSNETAGEQVFQKIFGPINKLSYSGYTKINDFFYYFLGTNKIKQENIELKEENIKLLEKNALLESLKSNEEYLKNEYELMNKTKNNLIQANIVSKDPGNLFIRFLIDKGLNDNCKVGDIAVLGVNVGNEVVYSGLIGKITSVGDDWAKVSSIMDDDNNISFKVARTGAMGVLDSRVEKGLSGYLFNMDENVLKNDYLLTAGIGNVYPENIIIGKISDFTKLDYGLKKIITVKPNVDFTKLSRIYVIPMDSYKPEKINVKNLAE